MKNSKLKSGDGFSHAAWLFLIFNFAFLIPVPAADQFGDITVSATALFTGNTFHGYAETRVLLENHSPSKTHVVSLAFPNNAYGNGNSISRLSRSVTLAPGVREVVSLLQPPLPAQGDGQIRVAVDNRREGEIRVPNNNHCNNYSSSSREGPATLLISRSLDFDAVTRFFNATRGAFTAAMAVGAPDAKRSGGYQPNTWMPDTRRGGQTNWLELDYATAQNVNKIVIHNTQPMSSSGFIELVGISGTNVATMPMSAGARGAPSSRWIVEFSLAATSQPVKTIRLNFERTPPYNIGVDAVEISGPTGSQWATEARASSDNSASASSYAPGSVNVDAVASLRAESPVSEWSENWLAYTPFDAIALNAADLSVMPPAVFNALAGYLAAGGNIFLAGKSELPAAWHATQKKIIPDGTEFSVGFGRCFAFPAEKALVTLDPATIKMLHEALRTTAQYWRSLPQDGDSANNVLSVVKNLKIPTRGIVVVMLAFIILIGPVNMILLNRRNRRTWMLWTIPAISFATTLLVFAYSLLREGITPDTRITGVTLIDQAAHRATTVGGTAFYCPLTPSSGLHFNFETEATPLVRTGYGSGTSREVDWTQSQHFSRGWISARVPAHFHLRKSETRRERLEIENQNGQLKIVNGLGAPIKALWLADSSGKIYQADNIAAGQQAALMPSSHPQVSSKLGAQGLLRNLGFAPKLETLPEKVEEYLLPGTYVATLDGNPFIENALGAAASPKRTTSGALVFGILETANNNGGQK